MAILTPSVLSIDSQFQVLKNFSWLPQGWLAGDVVLTDYYGGLHVNSKYRKELFRLQINNLNEALTDMVENLFIQTGTNVFHTVQVTTPQMNRVWDGTTAASGGTNTDIGRVRNKVYMTKFSKTNYDGNPNLYQITVDCQET